MALLKEKHPQRDFFVPEMFDNIGASFKDDIASMEYPIFTLSKNKDLRCLEYKKEDMTLSIIPSAHGLPTIFDKDILLYCMSVMMAEINAGRIPPKTLRVSCHDILVATNRRTDGRSYSRLKDALDRLSSVYIKTNIKTNKREITKGFGILDGYTVIESSKIKNRMIRLEIDIPDWFYNSMLGKEVLTINPQYFLLGKPIERRLYEIARKHCGQSPKWEIGLEKLMEKVGSSDTLRKFRLRLKEIAQDSHLPDYRFTVNTNDRVIFHRKHKADKQTDLPYINHKILKQIKGETVQRAQDLVSGTGWDFDAIIQQWGAHMEKTGAPDNINGALIGFVKKKVENPPL